MTENQKPFSVHSFRRRLRVVCRLPLLSLTATDHVVADCWERGQKIGLELAPRWQRIGLARTDDMPVLDYMTSKFVHAMNANSLCLISELSFDLSTLLDDLGLMTSQQDEVLASLRRLTGTMVTLRHWPGEPLPDRFPLLQIARDPDQSSSFTITLSTWLENEFVAFEVVSPARSAADLIGIRQRIYGWALAWVGPKYQDGRVIKQYEALGRVGPVPSNPRTAWDQIVAVVEANDLPDFELSIIEHYGQPAIYVCRRAADVHEWSFASRPGLEPLTLELDGELDITEVPPQPREVSIG